MRLIRIGNLAIDADSIAAIMLIVPPRSSDLVRVYFKASTQHLTIAYDGNFDKLVSEIFEAAL